MEIESVKNRASVVVIDDNPLILGVVRSLLQHDNFEVFACENGNEAFEVLSSRPVNLIICDVMMPEVSGYQVHSMVRSHPEFCHIPFIFLTALDSTEEKLKGKSSGADDYVTKPFDPKELIALARGKIERARFQSQQSEQRYELYRKKVLNTLSHEFRTPLVAINTGTELLLDQPNLDEKKLRTLVEAIQRGGIRLERLVNDFMTLQQIEAGQAKRVFEDRAVMVDIEEMVDRIVTHVKCLVTDEGGELIVERSLLPGQARVYEIQMLDIVARLIQNAMKFGLAPKKVSLSFLTQGKELVIQIEDNGNGFTDQQLRQSYSPAFNQINRDKFEQQGSGVGLAICSAYTEYHQAGLEFSNFDTKGNSKSESGARVRVILPTVRYQPR